MDTVRRIQNAVFQSIRQAAECVPGVARAASILRRTMKIAHLQYRHPCENQSETSATCLPPLHRANGLSKEANHLYARGNSEQTNRLIIVEICGTFEKHSDWRRGPLIRKIIAVPALVAWSHCKASSGSRAKPSLWKILLGHRNLPWPYQVVPHRAVSEVSKIGKI